VADERLLRLKTVKGNQMPVGGEQNPVPVLGKKGQPGDTIEKMIKPAFGIDRLEQV